MKTLYTNVDREVLKIATGSVRLVEQIPEENPEELIWQDGDDLISTGLPTQDWNATKIVIDNFRKEDYSKEEKILDQLAKIVDPIHKGSFSRFYIFEATQEDWCKAIILVDQVEKDTG